MYRSTYAHIHTHMQTHNSYIVGYPHICWQKKGHYCLLNCSSTPHKVAFASPHTHTGNVFTITTFTEVHTHTHTLTIATLWDTPLFTLLLKYSHKVNFYPPQCWQRKGHYCVLVLLQDDLLVHTHTHAEMFSWWRVQWNLVIKRSDITKPSYNKVILLVPAFYIS